MCTYYYFSHKLCHKILQLCIMQAISQVCKCALCIQQAADSTTKPSHCCFNTCALCTPVELESSFEDGRGACRWVVCGDKRKLLVLVTDDQKRKNVVWRISENPFGLRGQNPRDGTWKVKTNGAFSIRQTGLEDLMGSSHWVLNIRKIEMRDLELGGGGAGEGDLEESWCPRGALSAHLPDSPQRLEQGPDSKIVQENLPMHLERLKRAHSINTHIWSPWVMQKPPILFYKNKFGANELRG